MRNIEQGIRWREEGKGETRGGGMKVMGGEKAVIHGKVSELARIYMPCVYSMV